MKLGTSIALFLAAHLFFSPSPRADEIQLNDVVARATRGFGVRSPLEDNAVLDLIQRAQRDAVGAEVSLVIPPAAGTRVPEGPITARQALALLTRDERIGMLEMRVADLAAALERGAALLPPYRAETAASWRVPEGVESTFVAADGVSYELDLAAVPGQRVLHLAMAGAPLDSNRTLRVALTPAVAGRLGLAAPGGTVWTKDALLATLRQLGTLDGSTDHNWTLLPDYVTAPERPLIERLVRLGVAPRDEVARLYPDQPARRGDLAYWLSRAFAWREARLSGAFPDVPDSLEPWLEGLVRRRLLGTVATEEFFQPFASAKLTMAMDWCEAAARHARWALDTEPERGAFRRGLLAGTSLALATPQSETVTRPQLLGLIANARFPALRVLHTTDFHGAMLPRERGGHSIGGSATLAARLTRLRAENPEGTVLLDGGDAFQGTMISNLAFGRPVVEQMNRLGYAGMAIGNHDFDWSVDTLARRIGEMRFAAMGANIAEAANGKRPRWARSDTSLTRRGVRIGVLGLAFTGTPTTTQPRNVAMLRFGDDSSAAAALAPVLRKRGADAVIGLGHVPGVWNAAHEVDGQIARIARGVPGVDLWLGGHGHTWVAGLVAGAPVLIPGSHGEAIGICDLVVDPMRHRVVERSFRIDTTWVSGVAPDSAMQALVERWQRRIEALASVKVGASARRLGRMRGGESAVGSLVADVMRAAAGTEVALQNNGGLRADLPQGDVTVGAIYEVIPFENTVVTMELTGAELRRAIEEGLADEHVVQVSGIRYRFDLGRPAGARVTALLDAQERPLDEARTYRVACNDFMAEGGDGYVTLTRGGSQTYTTINVRDALEGYVRGRSAGGKSMDYSGDGRVTREPGSRPPARGD